MSPAGFPMSLRVVQDCYEDVKSQEVILDDNIILYDT